MLSTIRAVSISAKTHEDKIQQKLNSKFIHVNLIQKPLGRVLFVLDSDLYYNHLTKCECLWCRDHVTASRTGVFVVTTAAKTLVTLSLCRCLGHCLYHTQSLWFLWPSRELRAAMGILLVVETNPKHSAWNLAFGYFYWKWHGHHFPADASCHTSPFS